MPRYTVIAKINCATHRYEFGSQAHTLADQLKIQVHSLRWQDPLTNAYGYLLAIRTRHLKRLPKAMRRAILNRNPEE
jgi:hypothetical protein